MSNVAKDIRSGKIVYASDFFDEEWTGLKVSSQKGDYKMLCCNADAILKTSLNFTKFFAHYSGECSTGPEHRWHLEAKSLITLTLEKLGIECKEEFSGVNKNNKKWTADTYFEYEGRRIVIEIQNSYQTLKKYMDRQQIYIESGVECYWLLYQPRFRTLVKSLSRYRLEHDFGGVLPESGSFLPFIESLPCMWLDNNEAPLVRGVAMTNYEIGVWIQGILDERFTFSNGKWFIA